MTNMSISLKSVRSCIILRTWLGVPLGIWIAVSVAYYWWLISNINVLKTQNKVFKTQLNISQSAMRQLSVDSVTTYKVPIIPDANGTLCETVHIALVCMGKCMWLVTPMLKSLLHHRQNPLHFHVVIDATTAPAINTLFKTWDIPDVNYTCYNAQNWLPQVRWIPSSHYSGIYCLVKLLFPSILPATLKQVIVLDYDLTFLCDVAELWAFFRNMSSEQFVGLVENESDWYYEDNGTHWPALGRGYNTGVMLLDLRKIRNNVDWDTLWHNALNENLERLKQTILPDQDVINAIIKKNPKFIYNMSCQYNVQMSTYSLAKYCYGEDSSNIKIIHWNSPKKYNIRIRDSNYFRNIHQIYVNFDRNLLREKLHRCWETEVVTYKHQRKPMLPAVRRKIMKQTPKEKLQ